MKHLKRRPKGRLFCTELLPGGAGLASDRPKTGRLRFRPAYGQILAKPRAALANRQTMSSSSIATCSGVNAGRKDYTCNGKKVTLPAFL